VDTRAFVLGIVGSRRRIVGWRLNGRERGFCIELLADNSRFYLQENPDSNPAQRHVDFADTLENLLEIEWVNTCRAG